MTEVSLPMEQWQQVLAILASASWSQANPLIMAIGQQLQAQAERPAAKPDGEDRPRSQ